MHVRDLFDLKGKVAVVTGGSTGLGEQMCTALAEAGAGVVVAARRLERCEAAAEKLRGLGVEARPVKCDVSEPEDIDRLVDITLKEFGQIDILVNNAGITWGAPAENYPLDRWKKLLDVNVTGTFLCCQKIGRIMVERRQGKIINIASVCSFVGTDPEAMNAVGYHASKGAIVTMTRDLAAKWSRYGVNVNAIAPGWFPTHMTKYTLQEKGDVILRHIPMGRFGGGDDLKGAVLYLASAASDYVTGHVLCVDGGYLAV